MDIRTKGQLDKRKHRQMDKQINKPNERTSIFPHKSERP